MITQAGKYQDGVKKDRKARAVPCVKGCGRKTVNYFKIYNHCREEIMSSIDTRFLDHTAARD
ncbi:MAG: hypothetical protein PHN75_21260 [Syntrophales bacterium]|nr:hypothetical protein [Syntrophales bacterium]